VTVLAFWRAVDERLATGEPVFVVLVVANTRGSPGTLGARALVDARGDMQGTIGGGIMEANVLAQAHEALAQSAYPPRIQRLVHRRTGDADASGLICAGEQTNLSAVLVGAQDADSVAHFVAALEREDESAATLVIDADGLRVSDAAPDFAQPSLRLTNAQGSWQYAEENISRRRLAIVGAGHCGRALARLAANVGYRVDVFDTRADVMADGDWPPDVRCQSPGDYAELAMGLGYAGLTRVVVMTTAVTDDIEALATLATMNCRWLGVMGSRNKIRVIHQALQERGITRAALDRVQGPIGLAMKSDTPAEIAVSIMGELLAHEHEMTARPVDRATTAVY
jgi:xanthine dehydrogenase accessory factor